jgi:hypothetical protein
LRLPFAAQIAARRHGEAPSPCLYIGHLGAQSRGLFKCRSHQRHMPTVNTVKISQAKNGRRHFLGAKQCSVIQIQNNQNVPPDLFVLMVFPACGFLRMGILLYIIQLFSVRFKCSADIFRI